MGYDMYICETPAALKNLKVAADREKWTRGQPHPAHDAYWKAQEEYYFRLNISGMGLMRGWIEPIIDWDAENTPWPEDGTEEEAEAIISEETAKEGMVPGYKFCTNDGWLVTPKECTVIADYLDENPHEYEYMQKFGAFCKKAAECGGFKVY